MTFKVRRIVAGRRVNGGCVKRPEANRDHRHCKLIRKPFVQAHRRIVNGRCVKRIEAGRHSRHCTARITVRVIRRQAGHAGANRCASLSETSPRNSAALLPVDRSVCEGHARDRLPVGLCRLGGDEARGEPADAARQRPAPDAVQA